MILCNYVAIKAPTPQSQWEYIGGPVLYSRLTTSHVLIAADKYKKTETLTIKDKINRLNTHSIAKKTLRLSQQIKHETGMAPKVGWDFT